MDRHRGKTDARLTIGRGGDTGCQPRRRSRSMDCPMDGLGMKQGEMIHHFTDCGLDYVWLISGFEYRDTPQGRLVRIKNIDGLHAAIGRWIVQNPSRLRGAEVRFLRSLLCLSQEGLGRMLSQSRATIARWEGDPTKPIPTGSDHWLRVVYAKKIQGDREMCKLVDLLIGLDEIKHGKQPVRAATFADSAVSGWATADQVA